MPGCLQIQPNQFAGDIQNTYIFKKFHTIFLRDKPYNIRMQVKFVMSINEQVMMSSDQRSSLCNPTRLLIYEQQTWGLPYVHTHTRLTALFPGLPRWAATRKVEPIWILLKQETVSGSGISWAICKSAPCSWQITTPASHHSVFLQAGCPSCRTTNSIKALKGRRRYVQCNKNRPTCENYIPDCKIVSSSIN